MADAGAAEREAYEAFLVDFVRSALGRADAELGTGAATRRRNRLAAVLENVQSRFASPSTRLALGSWRALGGKNNRVAWLHAAGLTVEEVKDFEAQFRHVRDGLRAAARGSDREAGSGDYRPRMRSGGWAILIACLRLGPDAEHTRAVVVRYVERHDLCSAEMSSALGQDGYRAGAWAVVRTLSQRGLVHWQQHSRDVGMWGGFGRHPDTVRLTPRGRLLAAELAAEVAGPAPAARDSDSELSSGSPERTPWKPLNSPVGLRTPPAFNTSCASGRAARRLGGAGRTPSSVQDRRDLLARAALARAHAADLAEHQDAGSSPLAADEPGLDAAMRLSEQDEQRRAKRAREQEQLQLSTALAESLRAVAAAPTGEVIPDCTTAAGAAAAAAATPCAARHPPSRKRARRSMPPLGPVVEVEDGDGVPSSDSCDEGTHLSSPPARRRSDVRGSASGARLQSESDAVRSAGRVLPATGRLPNARYEVIAIDDSQDAARPTVAAPAVAVDLVADEDDGLETTERAVISVVQSTTDTALDSAWRQLSLRVQTAASTTSGRSLGAPPPPVTASALSPAGRRARLCLVIDRRERASNEDDSALCRRLRNAMHHRSQSTPLVVASLPAGDIAWALHAPWPQPSRLAREPVSVRVLQHPGGDSLSSAARSPLAAPTTEGHHDIHVRVSAVVLVERKTVGNLATPDELAHLSRQLQRMASMGAMGAVIVVEGRIATLAAQRRSQLQHRRAALATVRLDQEHRSSPAGRSESMWRAPTQGPAPGRRLVGSGVDATWVRRSTVGSRVEVMVPSPSADAARHARDHDDARRDAEEQDAVDTGVMLRGLVRLALQPSVLSLSGPGGSAPSTARPPRHLFVSPDFSVVASFASALSVMQEELIRNAEHWPLLGRVGATPEAFAAAEGFAHSDVEMVIESDAPVAAVSRTVRVLCTAGGYSDISQGFAFTATAEEASCVTQDLRLDADAGAPDHGSHSASTPVQTPSALLNRGGCVAIGEDGTKAWVLCHATGEELASIMAAHYPRTQPMGTANPCPRRATAAVAAVADDMRHAAERLVRAVSTSARLASVAVFVSVPFCDESISRGLMLGGCSVEPIDRPHSARFVHMWLACAILVCPDVTFVPVGTGRTSCRKLATQLLCAAALSLPQLAPPTGER